MHSSSIWKVGSLILPLLIGAAVATPTPGTNSPPTLAKRENTPDDATDPAKVLAWMQDNVDEDDPFVFWAGGSAGQQMAKDFCEANRKDGYKNFYTIFDDNFKSAFGDLAEIDYPVVEACSTALAQFSKGEVRVFKDAGSASAGIWKGLELPILQKNNAVTHIWSMNDNTEDPDAHSAGDIKGGDSTAVGPAFALCTSLSTNAKRMAWVERMNSTLPC